MRLLASMMTAARVRWVGLCLLAPLTAATQACDSGKFPLHWTMNRIRAATVFSGILVALAASSPSIGAEYLQSAPKDGTIPVGAVVYVDDGECPKGEIKELTGGSLQKSIPRK